MNSIQHILGLNVTPEHLSFSQMAVRGIIVLLATVVMIRIAGRRFISQRNPLDVMLAFILGSMLARDVNGSCAFFATLGAGLVMALFYRLAARWTSRSNGVGSWLKGAPDVLIKDGEICPRAMVRHQISRNDLMEDLRLLGHITDVADVKLAQIERSGDISVLRRPQVFTVNVERGVQTVQIHIS